MQPRTTRAETDKQSAEPCSMHMIMQPREHATQLTNENPERHSKSLTKLSWDLDKKLVLSRALFLAFRFFFFALPFALAALDCLCSLLKDPPQDGFFNFS
ncbi:hypothetical protein EUGRSUZ_J01836 [Eucalyptus grandis]|uniref:Uncharacterized protein n=2 Tax=Eucalyptus grandis TaxID=71139 RepID=A0ACC3J6M7_EUCGR|nr:hypothetical protein EUGRSUZ_J01836 [Eucalyptus grandis]